MKIKRSKSKSCAIRWNVFDRDNPKTYPKFKESQKMFLFAFYNPHLRVQQGIQFGHLLNDKEKGVGMCRYDSQWWTHWAEVPSLPELSQETIDKINDKDWMNTQKKI